MIELDNVTKVYGTGAGQFLALDSLSLSVAAGEIAAVVGPSGAGKSTLARCLNLLARPTSGTVTVNGAKLSRLGNQELRTARQAIGTVFQGSNLLARRTAAQNIALPLDYLGATPAAVNSRVKELLELVGLADKASSYPAQLSGGQRQRVGIARALALRPSVLLADEATSGLDPDSTGSILRVIRSIRDTENLSVVLITHEMDVVREIADSVARLDHGRIVEAGPLHAVVAGGSGLSEQLLPERPALPAPHGQLPWTLSYGADAVEPDWPQQLGCALDSRISVLSASIEAIGAQAVGRAVVGIDPACPPNRVVQALESLGLRGTLGDDRPPTEPVPAAALGVGRA